MEVGALFFYAALKEGIKSWSERNIWQNGEVCKKLPQVGYAFSEVIGGGAEGWSVWRDNIYYDIGNSVDAVLRSDKQQG